MICQIDLTVISILMNINDHFDVYILYIYDQNHYSRLITFLNSIKILKKSSFNLSAVIFVSNIYTTSITFNRFY